MKTIEEIKAYFQNAKIVREPHTGIEFELDFESIYADGNTGSIWANRCKWLQNGYGELAEIIEHHEPSVKFTNTELKQIQKPKHYDNGGLDVIDFCKSYNLNFNLGNVVKYCSRAGRKGDAIRDLEKAIDYLNREINYLKNK